MHCLDKLPEYYKLAALQMHFTDIYTIYKTVLCHCFDEKDIDAKCVVLDGDEVVFNMYFAIKKEKIIDLMEHVQIQNKLIKENFIVKFLV